MAGDRRERPLGEGRLDAADGRHELAVAVRDREGALVAHPQISLGQPEHVEVVAEARAAVEPAQCDGDPGGHVLGGERLVRHRPAGQPLEDEHAVLRQVMEHPRPDARLGGRHRVVRLVGSVDGQQVRRGTGDADEDGHAVDDDPIVRVRQAGGDRLDRDGPARPLGDRGDDLVDGGDGSGTSGRRLYRSARGAWGSAGRRAVPRRRAAARPGTLSVSARRSPASEGQRDEGGRDRVEHARAIVIGGGVGGTSIAYHLAERGWSDIVLLERADLTSGSTFHSAGLVGQLRSSVTLTKMMMYGVELYRRLRDETGTDPSWHEVGSLRLASSRERFEELERQAGWAKTFGLPLELISAAEAQARFPLMSTDGVLGAVFLPTDGWLDPSGLAFALAAGARSRGASIRTGTAGRRDRHGTGTGDGRRDRARR